MKKAFVDNSCFIERQVSYLTNLDLPKSKGRKTEVEYLKISISDLFQLFYECPLNSGSSKRVLRRFSRLAITRTIDLIRDRGYIQFSKDMKDSVAIFLKCFIFQDGVLSFKWDDRLSWLPISYAIRVCMRHPNNYILNRWILSCLVCLNKLPLTRSDLKISTFSKWLDIQVNAVKDVSDFNMDYVLALRQIVSWLVADSTWDRPSNGKHGPGNTTNGAKTVPEKEEDYTTCLQSELIFPTYRTHFWLDSPENSMYADVDKDTGSRRSITQESVPMMVAQQYLKRQIYDACDHGLINLSRFVKFSDQTRSQELALKYSMLSATPHTTVDLSWASDLVSSDLVAFVFSGKGLNNLMLARTWNIDTWRKVTDGVILERKSIEPRMYAGMGAATTFPVQTIIFTACAILATIISDRYPNGHKPTAWEGKYYWAVKRYLSAIDRKRKYASIFSDICVYGDDIILPDQALDSLLAILESFGLRVNVDKTFKGHDAVRESCGIFALNGRDITPLRFRIPLYDPTGLSDTAVFDAMRMLANRSYIFGYKSLSRRLVRRYEGLIPLMSSRELKRKWSLVNGHIGSPGLKSEEERNVEYVLNVKPEPLYEQFRGADATYVGLISSKKNTLYEGFFFGERKLYTCALLPKSETFSDRTSDRYHLPERLYQMANRIGEIEDPLSHGRVPRGTRFHVRIAYQLEIGDNTWAWAPAATM